MKVDPLLKTDKATIALEALAGGNIRVNAVAWSDPKVVLRDQVLEDRSMDGQLRIARKDRHYDDHDKFVEPYDPYGPGEEVLVAEAE
jgi:hypothetical protein